MEAMSLSRAAAAGVAVRTASVSQTALRGGGMGAPPRLRVLAPSLKRPYPVDESMSQWNVLFVADYAGAVVVDAGVGEAGGCDAVVGGDVLGADGAAQHDVLVLAVDAHDLVAAHVEVAGRVERGDADGDVGGQRALARRRAVALARALGLGLDDALRVEALRQDLHRGRR